MQQFFDGMVAGVVECGPAELLSHSTKASYWADPPAEGQRRHMFDGECAESAASRWMVGFEVIFRAYSPLSMAALGPVLLVS
jgi:hypothetical protein